jgi:TM2 domain-containing membrane protein YozV
MVARPGDKGTGTVHLFLRLLGGFSAHNFCLGRIGPAMWFLVLYWGGWALTAVGVGPFMLVAAFIRLSIDVFCIRQVVGAANARL